MKIASKCSIRSNFTRVEFTVDKFQHQIMSYAKLDGFPEVREAVFTVLNNP